MPFDWALFLGRFHLVLLHLPIGLAAALAIVELARVPTAWRPLAWATALGATLTAGLGWLLASDSGSYDADTLAWHRWGGVTVAVLAWGLPLLNGRRIGRRVVLVLVLLGSGLVGHQGGTLTHGEGFLTEHGPRWLGGREPAVRTPDMPGQVPLFSRDIQPLFNERCCECHGAKKQKGDLRLDTAEAIRIGGESGLSIVPLQPEHSLLLDRVMLPADHDDRMPPKGEPLTSAETAAIRAWIAAGAVFDGP